MKVLMTRTSHKNSNSEKTKSMFHHFCLGLPVSLTLCPILGGQDKNDGKLNFSFHYYYYIINSIHHNSVSV